MSDLAYRSEGVNVNLGRRTYWGAIWAGVFTFWAIWAVFETLGIAIFASVASPRETAPVLGMSVGLGVWSIVLTVIAMFVAGRETGRLAAVPGRHDGLIHGMIMFGLSFVGAVVLLTLGAISASGGATVANPAHSPSFLTMFANLGWISFIGLFLGWLAAMFGASSAAPPREQRTLHEVRPAA